MQHSRPKIAFGACSTIETCIHGLDLSFAVFEELVLFNTAQGWRLQGMKSDYEPVIVPPSYAMRIIDALENPLHKMLVLLAACTGLRASEALGLKWGDIKGGPIHVRRRWSAATMDELKTERSKAPVASHPTLPHFLSELRRMSPHASDSDWIFPSLKMCGRIPQSEHLRYGPSSSCRNQSWRGHGERAAVWSALVQIIACDVDDLDSKTDLKTAGSFPGRTRRSCSTDTYAPSPTKWLPRRGVFLRNVEWV
jgi:hypothetical protein